MCFSLSLDRLLKKLTNHYFSLGEGCVITEIMSFIQPSHNEAVLATSRVGNKGDDIKNNNKTYTIKATGIYIEGHPPLVVVLRGNHAKRQTDVKQQEKGEKNTNIIRNDHLPVRNAHTYRGKTTRVPPSGAPFGSDCKVMVCLGFGTGPFDTPWMSLGTTRCCR